MNAVLQREASSIEARSYIRTCISLLSCTLLAYAQIRGTVHRTIRPEFARFRKPSTFHVGIQSNGEEQLELVDADKEQRYVGHCLKNDAVQGMSEDTLALEAPVAPPSTTACTSAPTHPCTPHNLPPPITHLPHELQRYYLSVLHLMAAGTSHSFRCTASTSSSRRALHSLRQR